MRSRQKAVVFQLMAMILLGMTVRGKTVSEVIWNYGRARYDLKGCIYNARDRKNHEELVHREIHDDSLTFRGDFKTARSINSYLCITAETDSEIELGKTPVLEIRLKCSSAEKPLTLVWSKSHDSGKDWNYQDIYPLQHGKWETFLIRLDQPHKRNLRMKRLDSLTIQKNYEGNQDQLQIDVSYIRFRPPCDGDVYADGSRPLVRFPAAFKARPADDRLFSQFKFGVWGSTLGGMQLGIIDPFYCDNDYCIAGRFRANYLNSFMYPSTVWPGWDKKRIREKESIEPRFSSDLATVLRRQIDSCRRYRMTVAPLTQYVPRVGTFDAGTFRKKFLPLIQKFRDCREIFGWYLTDEPELGFMPTYNQVYPMIEEASPAQIPFVNLCNRYSAYRFTGDIAGMLVTDRYPIGNPTPYRRNRDAGLRNPWQIIDWVTEMENFSEGKPHYLILSAHTFFDTAFPTDAELRLQVYLALAHGADSLFFFLPGFAPFWLNKYIDRTLLDPYGNPSSAWRTIGALGKRLIPVGGFLAGAQLNQQLKVRFCHPNPPVEVCLGKRPAMEAQVRRKDNRYFVILWNNRLNEYSRNRISLENLPAGMMLSDLENGRESDGNVELAPGDGKILLVTSWNDMRAIAEKRDALILENEQMRVQFEIDMMAASVPECRSLLPDLRQAASPAQVLALEKRLNGLLEAAGQVIFLRNEWEGVRSAMGKAHRILSENVEAPKVIMYQYGVFPVSAVSRPGSDYVRQMLLMSLVFREVERGIQERGIQLQQERIVLMKRISEKFLHIVRREFRNHKPGAFSGLSEKELLTIIGMDKWNHYRQFLEKP